MTSYTKLTFASLKDLLLARGLPTTGTKAQLIARLKQQDRETEAVEKAMADAIKAASVASPPGDENTYGGKGADRDAAKKGKKEGKKAKKGNMKGGAGGTKDMKRKERDELSARMRFVRRLQARRAEMEAEMEDEVRRLIVGGEVGEGKEKGGEIVVNSTREGHANGLAKGRYAGAKQEGSEYVSEGKPVRYEKAVARKYVVLRLLLLIVILAVAGALVLWSGKVGEPLRWIVGLWENV